MLLGQYCVFLCMAGHGVVQGRGVMGGLTHIAVFFFVVKLAAARDRLGHGRGGARAVLFLIVCGAVSLCRVPRLRAAMLRPHIQRHDVPHFPGAMFAVCVER
jgi:hypothetical protein